MASLLLDQGADPNAKNNKDVTPLMIAASRGNMAIVRLLLDRGADARAKAKDGKTALDWANSEQRTEVAQLIRERTEGAGK